MAKQLTIARPDIDTDALNEIEDDVVLGFRLADAIRAGAQLVKGQARSTWISGNNACALGAAWLAVQARIAHEE